MENKYLQKLINDITAPYQQETVTTREKYDSAGLLMHREVVRTTTERRVPLAQAISLIKLYEENLADLLYDDTGELDRAKIEELLKGI